MSARIDKVTGDVKIKKAGQSSSKPATKGALIKDKDLLILGDSSSVEYTCDNGNGISKSKTTKKRYGLDDLCPTRNPMNLPEEVEKASMKLATAQWKLAEIKLLQNENEEAKTLLENAISNFSTLKDEDMVAYLQQKRDEL